MTNRRADDIGMALARVVRPERDVRRNQRVERAIDNQGNPILEHITLVAGGSPGTVLVVWGSILGEITDQEDLQDALDALQAAIDGKANTSHTHAASAVTSGTFDAARIPNLAASKITSGTFSVARLGTGSTGSPRYLRGDGSWQLLNIGAVSGLQDDLDAKADTSWFGGAVLTSSVANITSTTGQDITGLNQALGANQTWIVEWELGRILTTEADGYQIAVAVPSGATLNANIVAIDSDGTTRHEFETVSGGLSTAFGTVAFGTHRCHVQARITTGSTPGNAVLRVADVAGGFTTVYAGHAMMTARRIT